MLAARCLVSKWGNGRSATAFSPRRQWYRSVHAPASKFHGAGRARGYFHANADTFFPTGGSRARGTMPVEFVLGRNRASKLHGLTREGGRAACSRGVNVSARDKEAGTLGEEWRRRAWDREGQGGGFFSLSNEDFRVISPGNKIIPFPARGYLLFSHSRGRGYCVSRFTFHPRPPPVDLESSR